jgi:hypothetical protein
MLKLETLYKEHALTEIYDVLTAHDCAGQQLPSDVRAYLVRAYNDLSPVKIPTRQHLKRNKLKWLQDATTAKDVRPYLKCLHGCGGWLIGTCDHALHATRAGLNGTYKVVGKGKNVDLEQVEDDSFSTRAVEVFNRIAEHCLANPESDFLCNHFRSQKVYGQHVYIAIPDHKDNYHYYAWDAIYKAVWMVETIRCHISDNGELLLTIDENHKAIIMPCVI